MYIIDITCVSFPIDVFLRLLIHLLIIVCFRKKSIAGGVSCFTGIHLRSQFYSRFYFTCRPRSSTCHVSDGMKAIFPLIATTLLMKEMIYVVD